MLDSGDFVVSDLLERGRILDSDIDRAKLRAAEAGESIIQSLLALSVVDSHELAIARAAICEVPFLDLDHYEIDIQNAALLPRAVAEKNDVFPVFSIDGVVTLGMVDPLNLRAVDAVRQAIKAEIVTTLCDEEPLRGLISRAYSMASTDQDTAKKESDGRDLTTGEEPIVAAVNQILQRAADEGASDIHINPDEHELRIRYRVDGVLQTRQGPGISAHSGIVQRLKVMANLDLTQTRRAQDGKFRFQHSSGPIDVRVSVIPTVCGENVVLRLLRQGASLKGFADLGMSTDLIESFESVLAMPHGMILVTGPTGSGKTTTLYTALAKVNTPERNLMTIEDPVEIRLPMVRQTQANPELGLSFANALRSILRQDPDVILVGEIRDEETAQIAMQASLTGHMVLSTLHTNDAVGALARLRDFGLPPFAINSSLLCVLAQRLIRRLCDSCAKPDEPDEATRRAFGISDEDATGFFKGAGCSKCLNTGYRGRVGVYELFRMTHAVQGAIETGASTRDIHEITKREGFRLMCDDGLDKARMGLTTLDELWKVRTIFEDDSAVHRPTQPMRISA